MDRNAISQIVVNRLRQDGDKLRRDFQNNQFAARHFYVDNLLPEALTRDIYDSFPAESEMRLMSSFREKKFTSKALGKFNPLLSEITFALQSDDVIQEVQKITGLPQMVGDPHLYAGGLSLMTQGQYLNPHIDNSHDSDRKMYRMANALFYVTPDWQVQNGGNLELWDTSVRKRVEVLSLFNRLVIMETNRRSWHSVNPIRVTGKRCCVSNYYFSEQSPEGKDYFHITEFSARPEQPIRRVVAKVDSGLRTLVRQFAKKGVGPTDLRQ